MSYEIEHERVTKECGWSLHYLGEHYTTNCDRKYHFNDGSLIEDAIRCPNCGRRIVFEGETHE